MVKLESFSFSRLNWPKDSSGVRDNGVSSSKQFFSGSFLMRSRLLTGILALTVGMFSVHASAHTNRCEPTKSVESARVDYDAEIAGADLALKSSYTNAKSDYDRAISQAMNEYLASVEHGRDVYTRRMNAASANYNPGWREEMDAATAEFNRATELSLTTYNGDTTYARDVYTARVKEAQAIRNASVEQAAQRYNRSVCAKP